jgi:hypothetical protein
VLEREIATNALKAVIAGRFAEDSLENSYARAFRELGIQVAEFDVPSSTRRHTKLGASGELLNTFLPVEPWIAKANRELFLAVRQEQPDLLMIGGTSRVLPGCIAQIRASYPACRLVLLWPDPLQRLNSQTLEALPLYDLVASYSRGALPVFERLGAVHPLWIPFGFDPTLHAPPEAIAEAERKAYTCDVAFIGNHRPEREEALLRLHAEGFSVKVWGPDDWKRHCKNWPGVKAIWMKRPLIGAEYCAAVRTATVNLNIIDPTNFPSANMRFYEIMGCGGLAVNSACPELEDAFPPGECCLYYSTAAELVDAVSRIVAHRGNYQRMCENARRRILDTGTYRVRAESILRALPAGARAASLEAVGA